MSTHRVAILQSHSRYYSWSKVCVVFQAFGLHLFEIVSLCCSTDGEERTYGGCEGPDAMYVKLISSDGHEFIVKREHALTSGTIKAMLSGPGEDSGKLVKLQQTTVSSPYVNKLKVFYLK